MNRIAVGVAALAAVLLVGRPAGAAAQGADLDLRLTPRVGVLTPVDWFFEEYKRFGALPLQWTQSAIQKAAVVGLMAEAEVRGSGVWLRAEVLRTVGGELSLNHAVYTPPSTAGPATVVRTRYTVPASVLIGTVDLGLPTVFRLPGGIQPYITAGLGGKRYDFDLASVLEFEDALVLPEEGTSAVLNVGGGATFSVLGVDFDLLIRDAVSTYWDRTQHDVMFLAGLAWTVF